MSLLSLDQIKTLYNDLRGRIEANEEGTFPEMSVGSLISDEKISNNAPYLYRPVLNGVGNRAYSKLIGATIANNQLVQNGNFADASVWASSDASKVTFSAANNIGVLTVASTPTTSTRVQQSGIAITDNHKYLMTCSVNPSAATKINITLGGGSLFSGAISDSNTWTNIIKILNGNSSNSYVRIYPSTDSSLPVGGTLQVKNLFVVDLTAMLGSTIADYAATLETGEAGAGIAWLKSYGFFSKYAPYDAGSLISTKAEKKKVVGKNLLALSMVVLTSSSTWSPDAFFIQAGTYHLEYIVSNAANWRLGMKVYDTSGNAVGNDASYQPMIGASPASWNAGRGIWGQGANNTGDSYNLTFPKDCKVRFCVWSGGVSASTTVDNVQLEIGLIGTAYTPYTSQEYDLGSDELRGLFKLDANNNIYADGDIKTPDGTITRKYGTYTFTGSEQFVEAYQRTNGDYYCTFNLLTNAKASGNGISSNGVEFVDPTTAYGGSGTYFALRDSTRISVYVAGATSYSDVMAWLTTNKPTVIFELATPTTEQGTPFIDPSIVYPNGTEEYIDTRTVPVSVGNETEYTEDLKGGLETILDTPSANGTYVLKATVSGGVATLGWVAE